MRPGLACRQGWLDNKRTTFLPVQAGALSNELDVWLAHVQLSRSWLYGSSEQSGKLSVRGIDSRQGAKHAKFGGKRCFILEELITIFLRALRPWRLCARSPEVRLQLAHAKSLLETITGLLFRHLRNDFSGSGHYTLAALSTRK